MTKYTVNCHFLRYYGKIHSKLPIFCVKSVKIYTGQKKFTRTCPWRPWQISGMVFHPPSPLCHHCDQSFINYHISRPMRALCSIFEFQIYICNKLSSPTVFSLFSFSSLDKIFPSLQIFLLSHNIMNISNCWTTPTPKGFDFLVFSFLWFSWL